MKDNKKLQDIFLEIIDDFENKKSNKYNACECGEPVAFDFNEIIDDLKQFIIDIMKKKELC